MAVPTIISVTPAIGHTRGGDLVEIRGTGFQPWVIPPIGNQPLPCPWPTVRVLFGGVAGRGVQVVSSSRLFVRPPPSPLGSSRENFGEGAVDVTVQNLTQLGQVIYEERATLPAAFNYRRVQLSDETDYGRLARQVVREMRRQIINNVSISTHSDFDLESSDLTNIVDVAALPSLVLFGPTLQQSRFYSISGRVYANHQGFEADGFSAPDTDDLMFTFMGISDNKEQSLNLQSLVRQWFKRNREIQLDRDPTNPDAGQACYDVYLSSEAGIVFNAPFDQKSNLKSFSGTFYVRGFDHEALAGFPLADRVARTHAVLPEGVSDEPSTPTEPTIPPPASSDKAIVNFDFPEGVGTITGNAIAVKVPLGTDVTTLIPTIVHNGASISPASGVAQDFTTPKTYVVTAADGSTKVYTVSVSYTQVVSPGSMQVGTNFWYHTQRNLQDSGQEDYAGEHAMIAGINWATAYGDGTDGLAATNIWNPIWLAELAPYSLLRFMDWGNTNWSQISSWSQRLLPTSPDNVEQYSDDESTGPNPGMAYEWMIDLCNRLQKDLWVCVPHAADLGYWDQLAALIHAKLDPSLKVYVEYSNETWNGTFGGTHGQFTYVNQQGELNELPGDVDGTPNIYYQGQTFCLVTSLNIFAAFQAAFGAPAMGTRVIRVFSYGGNTDTARQAFTNVYLDATYNPDHQVVDLLCIAPYIGTANDVPLDGSDPNIATQFHTAIDEQVASLTAAVASITADRDQFNIAAIGCYEGGQSLYANSQVWTENPLIYDEYRYMLSQFSEIFSVFNHYTHTSQWTNAAGRSSWGAVNVTGQDLEEVHKYRALLDYVLGNP